MRAFFLTFLFYLSCHVAIASDFDALHDGCIALQERAKQEQCEMALARLTMRHQAPVSTDKILLHDAHISIANILRDSESARFQNEFISPNKIAVCGEVNAKNSMGGYSGFKRFIVTAEKAGIYGDGTYFVESRWQERCVKGTLVDE